MSPPPSKRQRRTMQSHSSVNSKVGASAENGTLAGLKEVTSSPRTNAANPLHIANGDYLESNGCSRKSSFNKRHLSKTDEEIIRLIGQHLCSIGFQ